MRLFGFMRMMIATVRRVELTSCPSHREIFVKLGPLLISAQDRGVPFGLAGLLVPYRTVIEHYTCGLAKDREAQPGSVGVFRSLPLGCRFGKLHFSPLLQLVKIAAEPNIGSAVYETLPRSRLEIRSHLLSRIGLEDHAGEPASFKTMLGFSLLEYGDYLFRLRRDDPVLFVMLVANEFRYARDWVAVERDEDRKWIESGAALAELERLVEIVSFLKTHPLRLGDLRRALRILAKGSSSRQQKANLLRHRELLPYLEQLSYSSEGIRASFLGDSGGRPLAPEVSWAALTLDMRHKAAARGAWFADDQPLAVHRGFRLLSKRLVRGQRNSAYTYYGVPLDHLLIVGLKDLATALGEPGGVHAGDHLASALHRGLFGDSVGFDSQARRAPLYSEVYLRERGHGGSSNRFDARCWFETSRDEALYGRLWSLFVTPAKKVADSSVRYQIRSSIAVLRQLLAPFWRGRIPSDAATARSVVAQLTCGLTPISMDPIFATLLERALVERNVPKEFRTDPARNVAKVGGRHMEAYIQRFVDPDFPGAYARFVGIDGRPNHKIGAPLAAPLIRRRNLPAVIRQAATSTGR